MCKLYKFRINHRGDPAHKNLHLRKRDTLKYIKCLLQSIFQKRLVIIHMTDNVYEDIYELG